MQLTQYRLRMVTWRRRLSPGQMRRMTVTQLVTAQRRAGKQRWSAVGRPEWVAPRQQQIQVVLVEAVGPEQSAWRFIVHLVLNDGTARYFTLDMAPRDFLQLPPPSAEEVRTLSKDERHVPVLADSWPL